MARASAQTIWKHTFRQSINEFTRRVAREDIKSPPCKNRTKIKKNINDIKI